eukprot:CAMPEP_0174259794 /NCGR_PEP_ID=MMETSP0439-20130205/8572_1 /TAXON_ID=0 /ORGANISM="Stereomyxa ramosa, Strain Chinc5" /LENGTH=390 /DNA_ID=CAMNT_0015343825 /DNA_START=249 /DNA_END=1421 /DNA_ORIENTATION=+
MLRSENYLDSHYEVASFSSSGMSGGCHYSVGCISLTYKPSPSNGLMDGKLKAPNGIVLKLLMWEKTIWQKLWLLIKSTFWATDKQVQYLRSYQIESDFYGPISAAQKGFKLPSIYYNYADTFNCKFSLGMEPINVAEYEGGQQMGFSKEDCCLCLTQLAKFHAAFWQHPKLRKWDVWKLGGYWTGYKRLEPKQNILDNWNRTMNNFSGHLNFTGTKRTIGQRLHNHVDEILKKFDKLPRRTLIHGDFKVTNLFIDTKKRHLHDEALWVIDWQWLGRGSGAIDVIYFLFTSADLHQWTNQTIKEITEKVYFTTLVECGVKNLTFEEFWQELRYALIDFFLYVVGSKWCFMWPNDIIAYAEKGKDGLHLRSFTHMQRLIELTEEFMDEMGLV